MLARKIEGMMEIRERLTRAVARVAPRAAAYLDWIAPKSHISWGGPMNGQARRRDMVRALITRVDPEIIIETGTFRGGTTSFLADVSGLDVYSAEISLRYYEFARWRLRGREECHLYHADSRAFLRALSKDPATAGKRALFYLDAHWDKDLPLRAELEQIALNWPDSMIMIDDFRVPGDPGYAYDDYGPGARLTDEILPPSLDAWTRLYPSVGSSEESGARRGCIVLAAPHYARAELAIPGLRYNPASVS